MAQPLPSKGTITPGQFAPLLRVWMSRLAVGRLELNGEGWTRQIWMDLGHVRAIVGDREDEKFGNWLVKRGLMEELSMAMALLHQPQGMRFGAWVVQQGLLTLEVVEAELQAMAIAIMSRVLFAACKYTFHEGERVSNDSTTLDMTTATLLISAVRALENLTWLEPLMRSAAYLWGAQDAFSAYQKALLSPSEGAILEKITGGSTVPELRKQVATMSQDEFLRSLGALVFAGYVVLRERPAEAQTPAPKVVAPKKETVTDSLQFSLRQEKERVLVVRLAGRIRQQNFYDRLQLNPGATQGQVYMRYREFGEVFHPDRASEPHLRGLERELAEIFACVTEAYDTLGHEEGRRGYDRREMMGWRPTSASLGGGGIPADDEPEPEVIYAGSKEDQAAGNVKRAKEMIAAGNMSGAVDLLDQTVRTNPEPAVLLQLARLELRNPLWAKRAVDHLRHAVSIDPRFTDGWIELAQYWKSRNEAMRQRECLVKVLSYDPGNREAQDALRAIK
jgi:hypothetical protein